MIHGKNKAIEKTYRKNKKVKGGELGIPNLAATKPVLQINTNTMGIRSTQLALNGFDESVNEIS